MYPTWEDNLAVPTVGDDVHIPSGLVLTVDAHEPSQSQFQVSVQPKTPSGILCDRAVAIGDLLRRTNDDTVRFLNKYFRGSIDTEGVRDLRVDLKNILENHRSALEYAAHYVADSCNPKPAEYKVQFPVAKQNDTASEFARQLDKWFPGLSTSAPPVTDYLMSIQEFSGDLWLRQLAELTNYNKHRSLTQWELADFGYVVVGFFDAGMRFGDCGLQSMTIEAGGVLRFEHSGGEHADLEGPVVIDANTTLLLGVDSRIEVVRQKRHTYGFPGYEQSIAHVLWSIDKNVIRSVDRICGLLSQQV